MADHGTAIEWTQAPGFKGETWNPVTGCNRVSPGCAHCYALDLAARLKGMGQKRYQRDGDPKTSGPGFGLTLHPDKLEEPLRWRKPRMVFVNSMSDLFHEEIPDEFIARVFAVMAAAEQHVFQVLTKRPERMQALLSSPEFTAGWGEHGLARSWLSRRRAVSGEDWLGVLPNVWLGVSIENRRYVGRADLLRQTPAAVRFISAEPLLGPLIYDAFGYETHGGPYGAEPINLDAWEDGFDGPDLDLTDIDWLIAGGESGREHRPIREEWVEQLRFAAEEEETAFFFKQWGGRTPKAGGRELDGRTWDEWPAALQAPIPEAA